ncbi:RNA polymerase sigma factor [Catalinimonas niigatensis]|uniref:RNA polymerase sigma factor n=1 Tax=Catalinimonas niigatensis TaxID=1397264 RepID=UPI002665A93E|nr:sigma-70 family RNA polymerase sigma factor [Catalinimonas niigatensis]WPP51981.1 sigma-70 family RNA polymerase sigma factor [Catalinimonas niigatensis]
MMSNSGDSILYKHKQESGERDKLCSSRVIASATKNYKEQELWESFIRGNESAYDLLYQISFHSLYNYGMKLCSQHDLVKDSIHDLFIDLWKYRSNPSRIHAIKPYQYKALRNIILKAQAKNLPSIAVEEAYHFSFDTSTETKLILQETQDGQRDKLQNALNSLTQKQREVIFLKFFDQLSYEDVANVLGISTKATYKLVARAIGFLRKKMMFITVLFTLFG